MQRKLQNLVPAMEFANPELNAEFERIVAQLPEDRYESKTTLGLHEVIRAHYLIVDFFLTEQGELGGIGPRDIRLLESALYRPWIEFGGHRKWDDPLDKVATTLFGLIKDHPFHDANKRTALLAVLFLLLKQGRVPQCSKDDFENLTVEIAEMEIVKRARYKKLTEEEEDPEIKYISQWLRRNTRMMDRREYSITYRDLRRILGRYGFVIENPTNNMIDVVKIEKRSGLVAFFSGSEIRHRIGRLGYPGDTRQVSRGDIRKVRRMCNLTPDDGIDSQSFYHDVDDMTSLIAEYQNNLRRLANR
jgi:prophage maintenance system killer protein